MSISHEGYEGFKIIGFNMNLLNIICKRFMINCINIDSINASLKYNDFISLATESCINKDH